MLAGPIFLRASWETGTLQLRGDSHPLRYSFLLNKCSIQDLRCSGASQTHSHPNGWARYGHLRCTVFSWSLGYKEKHKTAHFAAAETKCWLKQLKERVAYFGSQCEDMAYHGRKAMQEITCHIAPTVRNQLTFSSLCSLKDTSLRLMSLTFMVLLTVQFIRLRSSLTPDFQNI